MTQQLSLRSRWLLRLAGGQRKHDWTVDGQRLADRLRPRFAEGNHRE